jgi:hypothetical protein
VVGRVMADVVVSGTGGEKVAFMMATGVCVCVCVCARARMCACVCVVCGAFECALEHVLVSCGCATVCEEWNLQPVCTITVTTQERRVKKGTQRSPTITTLERRAKGTQRTHPC